MQRKNIIFSAVYGILILSIAYLLLADKGLTSLTALFR